MYWITEAEDDDFLMNSEDLFKYKYLEDIEQHIYYIQKKIYPSVIEYTITPSPSSDETDVCIYVSKDNKKVYGVEYKESPVDMKEDGYLYSLISDEADNLTYDALEYLYDKHTLIKNVLN